MKYIIDIEEKPLCVFDEGTRTYFPRLWRVKGFNSLVFDEEGLSRLEELTADYINEHFSDLKDTAYQRGLNDAWEAARKIGVDTDHGGINLNTLFKVFSAQEAIAKLKAYEEKQKAADEIKVGDEVEVVRCKDCEHFVSPYGCRNGMIAVDEKGFCSYGERKKKYTLTNSAKTASGTIWTGIRVHLKWGKGKIMTEIDEYITPNMPVKKNGEWLIIKSKDGEVAKYKPDEYTDYSYDKICFIVIRDKQWIAIYNIDEIKCVEVVQE